MAFGPTLPANDLRPELKYPNIRKGVQWGCVTGAIFASLWLALCYRNETSAREMKSCFSVGPWWVVAEFALGIFVVTGAPVGIVAAFRPVLRRRKR